jgi:hypothetical protein
MTEKEEQFENSDIYIIYLFNNLKKKNFTSGVSIVQKRISNIAFLIYQIK